MATGSPRFASAPSTTDAATNNNVRNWHNPTLTMDSAQDSKVEDPQDSLLALNQGNTNGVVGNEDTATTSAPIVRAASS